MRARILCTPGFTGVKLMSGLVCFILSFYDYVARLQKQSLRICFVAYAVWLC